MVMPYQNPWNPLQQLRGELDRLISGFAGNLPDGPWSGAFRGRPAVNVWEENDALMVEMEIPGVKSEQLDVAVAGGELTVKVDCPDGQQEGTTYHRRERAVGGFTRTVPLPVEVDADHVEAQLRDGVLRIRLPKAASAKPRKINIVTG
jgi:HSP20 family protein